MGGASAGGGVRPTPQQSPERRGPPLIGAIVEFGAVVVAVAGPVDVATAAVLAPAVDVDIAVITEAASVDVAVAAIPVDIVVAVAGMEARLTFVAEAGTMTETRVISEALAATDPASETFAPPAAGALSECHRTARAGH